jgi:hypothetical protein
MLQYSVAVRNAQLDAVDATVGQSAVLEIRSGEPPDDCAEDDAGELLCAITLPEEWMAGASGGAKSRMGEWRGTGVAAGIAGHFRFKNRAQTNTHVQGTITGNGGDGDMFMDNPSIAPGQTVLVQHFGITAANA